MQGLASACLSGHGFTFYSDLTSTAQDVSLENVNPVEALLGEGGLAEKYGGDSAFASKCVAVSTVLSLITTPLWCMVV